MGLFNIKMQNKKGVSDLILAIIPVIIIIVIIIFAGYKAKIFNQSYEEKTFTKLGSEYPVVFVYTFLNSGVNLNLTQKEKLGLDVQRDDYVIKDIIILDTNLSRDIVNKKREEYLNRIEEFKDSYGRQPNDYYDLSLSQRKEFSDYLVIEKFNGGQENLETLEDNYYDFSESGREDNAENLRDTVKGSNYYSLLSLKNGGNVAVYFRK